MINLQKLIFLSIKHLNCIIFPIVLLKRYDLRISLVEYIRRKKHMNKNGSKLLKIVKKFTLTTG